ncbi:hypothetical protein TNCT_155501 [Trichonephila clavata]|uniref:Uncharacterized protein n=1 Tax=Trichonephila clavata TaxID=2740835 RepID=A0A8X6K7J4_TRICU|nr:hypothetical protein TNCT_155501 [Trichonephila clavata]
MLICGEYIFECIKFFCCVLWLYQNYIIIENRFCTELIYKCCLKRKSALKANYSEKALQHYNILEEL